MTDQHVATLKNLDMSKSMIDVLKNYYHYIYIIYYTFFYNVNSALTKFWKDNMSIISVMVKDQH